MSGLEVVPIRWPENYDPRFMEIIFREVLALADARNVIEGVGIGVEGTADEKATITNTAAQATYVVLTSNAELENERILTPETDVLVLTDNGAGLTVVISVKANGLSLAKLQQVATARILGRVTAATGNVEDLTGAQARAVMILAVTDAVAFLTVEAGVGGFIVDGEKVVGAQEGAIASFTDNTTGTGTDVLAVTGDTSAGDESGPINDNFASLSDKVEEMLGAMRTHGLIDT